MSKTPRTNKENSFCLRNPNAFQSKEERPVFFSAHRLEPREKETEGEEEEQEEEEEVSQVRNVDGVKRWCGTLLKKRQEGESNKFETGLTFSLSFSLLFLLLLSFWEPWKEKSSAF